MNIILKNSFMSKNFSIKNLNQFSLSLSNSSISGKCEINKGVGINVYALDNSTWKKIIFDKGKMMDNSNKQLDLFTSKYLNMGKVTGISDILCL